MMTLSLHTAVLGTRIDVHLVPIPRRLSFSEDAHVRHKIALEVHEVLEQQTFINSKKGANSSTTPACHYTASTE